MEPRAEWFRCIACGKRAGWFSEAFTARGQVIPAGAVVHEKPTCLLYKQSDAEQFIALHRDVPRLPQPDKIEPILG